MAQCRWFAVGSGSWEFGEVEMSESTPGRPIIARQDTLGILFQPHVYGKREFTWFGSLLRLLFVKDFKIFNCSTPHGYRTNILSST